MDVKLVQSINNEIYRRFPDLAGCSPRVQTYRTGKPRSLRSRFNLLRGARQPIYLLVYQGRRLTSTGKTLPYIVRVTVEENGKILKTTLSR